MTKIQLRFSETSFTEEKIDSDTVLDLDEEDKTAILSFAPYVDQIRRRSAQRQARSIIRTGFRLANGNIIGRQFQVPPTSSKLFN
ncbi:MAG: hypothetical protein ACE5OZ_11010 [Candidatus Heimdallarchaeota archaeon]